MKISPRNNIDGKLVETVNHHRQTSINRTRKRHLENSAVQYKANQAIVKDNAERLADLDPALVRELSQKRSLKIKNPKGFQDINELPKKALKNCVTDLMLKADQQAVSNIILKI